MTKIKSGILGGFSGSIHSITGYRRNGKSIITAKGKREGTVLDSYIRQKNKMIKDIKNIPNTLTALERRSWFTEWNYNGSLSQRLKNLQQNFWKKNETGWIEISPLGAKFQNLYVGFSIVKFFDTKKFNWRFNIFPPNTVWQNLKNTFTIFYNLSQSTYFINKVNITNDSYDQSSPVNFCNVGDHIIIITACGFTYTGIPKWSYNLGCYKFIY